MVRTCTYTEVYRINTESQGLVPAHFALIIIIAMHVVKHQSGINKYMQKAGEPENDAGFLKVIIIVLFHVRPKKNNYSRLHMMSYPNCYSLAPLGLLPLISMGKYIKIDSFQEAKCKRYVYVLLPE